VADKPEVVDLISEATRQVRRRIVRRAVEPDPQVKKQSRLSHRSNGMAQWREATFTPWKLKPWNWKDWD
jgi:hypothetical protein